MARYPSRAGVAYAEQANNYYVDMVEALARFRQDALTSKNPAIPVAGLFLAAARAVGRLRLAPLEEISPQDQPFALAVKETLMRDFTDVPFEVTQLNARQRSVTTWVGVATLESVELDAGFGYAPTDRMAGGSSDKLEFRKREGGLLVVDCADLVASENAGHDTYLRITTGLRPDVRDRYGAFAAPPAGEPPRP